METLSSREGRSGFTLVEMLVVMAIISLLAGLLLPAVMTVRVQMKKAASGFEIGNLEVAMTSFYGDFGFYPPDGHDDGSSENVRLVDSAAATSDLANHLTAWGTTPIADPDAAQLMVFFLSTRFRANPTAAGEYRLVLVDDPGLPTELERPQLVNGGPYYDFPDAPGDTIGRVRGYRFIDLFGMPGRYEPAGFIDAGDIHQRYQPGQFDYFFYQFDNNDDDNRSTPLWTWNIADVKTDSVDIWSAGHDGVDYVVWRDAVGEDLTKSDLPLEVTYEYPFPPPVGATYRSRYRDDTGADRLDEINNW